MEQIGRFDFRLERNVLPTRYVQNDIKIPIYLPKTCPVFSLPVDDWICEDWIREVILHGKWEINGKELPERVWIKKDIKKIDIEVLRRDEKIRIHKEKGKTKIEADSYKAIITEKGENNPFEKVFGENGRTKSILILGEIPDYKDFLGYKLEDKFEGKIFEIEIKNDYIRFIGKKNILIIERKFFGEVRLLREIENYIGLRTAEVPKRVLIEIIKTRDINEAIDFLKRRYIRTFY